MLCNWIVGNLEHEDEEETLFSYTKVSCFATNSMLEEALHPTAVGICI